MGLSSCKHDHAWYRNEPRRRDDRGQAPPHLRRRFHASGLIAAYLLLTAFSATAETFRAATFNTELSRKGPGLLLRDILKGDDPQVLAVISTITETNADVIALQGIDYDLENRALSALRDAIERAGTAYPYTFSGSPNAGLMTELDLDGDGRTGGPGDAQGFGRFFGQGSMAVLSKHPINVEGVQDHAALLWRDLPAALLPETDGMPFPSPAARDIQRLSSHGAWVIPVRHPTLGTITIMTYHATPPVFDGPEDRNGKRNHDETLFWAHLIDGRMGTAPAPPFVLLGDANLDPNRGDGLSPAMQTLLAHPAVQDPLPDTPTVSFDKTGPLRVDYVLPSADWTVANAQVRPQNPDASRHSLVWVDLNR
jgi:endonuclease/exonuclease/phosphatase family metal-dependent hydrolase